MARFKLAEGETLIIKQMNTPILGFMNNLKLVGAERGTLYLTDKRIAFCSTSRLKTLIIFNLYGILPEIVSSKNIRFEAELNRFDILNLKYWWGNGEFLVLDGEKTLLIPNKRFKEEFFKLKQG